MGLEWERNANQLQLLCRIAAAAVYLGEQERSGVGPPSAPGGRRQGVEGCVRSVCPYLSRLRAILSDFFLTSEEERHRKVLSCYIFRPS